MEQSVIFYARRSPIGKLSGCLSSVPAPQLGAQLVKDLLRKTSLSPDKVDEIIMGNVLPAGVGQAPARQTAIYGGLPKSVCAMTINKVCGSGLKAVMLADQALKLGDASIILAGGQESMSLAPHLLPNSRSGYRFGGFEAKDHMQWDGLWDPYGNMAMGQCGDICAKEYQFSREAQDAFAAESYMRARNAWEKGLFSEEIVPIEVHDRKGTITVMKDEEPFSVDLAKLSTLRPAFGKDGTITAANASSINDGAALVGVATASAAKASGLAPIAKIVASASFAQDPTWFTTAPVGAIKKVLAKAGLSIGQIDCFEINEAFAVVPMVAMKDLGIPHEKVNVLGGAVSLGHPIGASGARLIATLISALKHTGGKRGLVTLCIGGGEASAMILELV
jgi:acetyl-CoA C-acetyltransferase